ncbi:hypothetical protein ACTQ53_06515 [Prevotella sp. Sow4_E9_plate]|uniref:hypothetical protein n=1 Tax=Prevotella sp. Sow4_E9_plate TaxID=3438802 RepID=UPI003F9B3F73
MKAKKQNVLFTFLPFYLFTFNIIKGMKDEGKEAECSFYLFTFNIIKGMKDEGKEAECSFYLFTLLPFYL